MRRNAGARLLSLLNSYLQFIAFPPSASEIEKLYPAVPLPAGIVLETLEDELGGLIWAIAKIRHYLAQPVTRAGLYLDPGRQPLQGTHRPTYAFTPFRY